MTIARLISDRSTDMISCQIGTLVSDALQLLAQHRIGALPVMDGLNVAGIFSERDMVYRLAEHGPAMLELTVGRVMTSPVISVEPATSVLNALSLMTMRRIRHLPVLSAGRMVAFISIGDLVKYRIERIQSEADAMREYIQMA
ncbi:CBS domain-containing protein [Novosphingobium sp. FSY-8]|uniref:CBS domain-containing protein n=1 Tax=Novosphingobium ovatum TaxID=1908523 RepID=A0ABW9XHE9_9SPHN|nr:CBS domain-containing protein [Novosphingobium ovatum]NBC37987.1 CBS domain-containing protein [Novosphingobium ovatum]